VGTRITAVDISDPLGGIASRGSVEVAGRPLDRTHMDALGNTFRIATFTEETSAAPSSSNLFVIDTTNLDALVVEGALTGIGPGERLHATRFDGDRAYVVTYKSPFLVIDEQIEVGGDPLWIVSLADPRNPAILGELHVPGWSDYIFPRGNQLVAVGRGEFGARVAVALDDISDPTHPVELDRVEFGIDQASSEANTDFRGVTIVEPGPLGTTPLIAIPFTNNLATTVGCTPDQFIELVNIDTNQLLLQGSLPQVGTVRRTLPVGDRLYTISDKTIAAVNVSNRFSPLLDGSVAVGDLSVADPCTTVFLDSPQVVYNYTYVGEAYGGGCAIGRRARPGSGALPLALLLVLLVARRRSAL
jgi:hypothetical protein